MSDVPPNVPPDQVPPADMPPTGIPPTDVPPSMPSGASPMDINDNDRLMALLAYLITPIVPVIILLVDTMKVRPYQKYHAIQALALGIAAYVYILVMCTCGGILTVFVVGICIMVLAILGWIPMIYYAYLAYAKPSYFEIPVLTKFLQQQGWLKV